MSKSARTVDRKNGDMGPRAISLAERPSGSRKGSCSFATSTTLQARLANGTTIEVLDPDPHSKPVTFTQSTKIEGCDGDAVTADKSSLRRRAGQRSRFAVRSNRQAREESRFSHQDSVRRRDAFCGEAYAPEDIYIGDSKTGSIVKLAFVPVSSGNVRLTQVITGFGTNKSFGLEYLGPIRNPIR